MRVPSLAWRVVLSALVVLVAVLALARPVVLGHVARRVRAAAAERGLAVRWKSLAMDGPTRVRFQGLVVTDAARGDTLLVGEQLRVTVSPFSFRGIVPRVSEVELRGARVRAGGARGAEADTLAPEEPETPTASARPEKLRRTTEAAIRLLLLPARDLPRLELHDVALETAEESLVGGGRIHTLRLDHDLGGVRLRADGAFGVERVVPFEVDLRYAKDDRLSGGARFGIPDTTGAVENLRIAVAGRLVQDRAARRIRLDEGTRVTIGKLPVTLGGSLESTGPRLRVSLAADSVTEARVVESLPRAVLGPLLDLSVTGSFDYRLAFDLDLAQPDSVDFDADVVPHGLALDAAGTRLPILGLDRPFTAIIHLPKGREARRDLSPANPSYRPLVAIDPVLVHAVVTNEDGGFFHHRGFNVEAMKNATAENLKAGAYRRGAGTITMQLARNLFLGHQRTLSRKMQEIVLAWVLENLTGLPKQRLLEIYLNIIEWGPGVHGAAEASEYYFGRDPSSLTVDEALFMTIVIPSPLRWRGRFAPDHSLRRYARAQMHYIGRKMVQRGWLDDWALPPTDGMWVTLTGPARLALPPAPPPDTTRADSTRADSVTIRGPI